MNKFKDFLIESSLSRLQAGIANHPAGAITAFRGEFTRAENKARNKKLLAVLLTKGFSVTSVKGSYIENFKSDSAKEVGEESLFVIDRNTEGDGGELERVLIGLGRLYDQDSILSVRKGVGTLIGTSKRDNSYPGLGVRQVVGPAKFGIAKGEFFSRVKGRQFAFESIESVADVNPPDTINGLRSMKIVAEEVINEVANLT